MIYLCYDILRNLTLLIISGIDVLFATGFLVIVTCLMNAKGDKR